MIIGFPSSIEPLRRRRSMLLSKIRSLFIARDLSPDFSCSSLPMSCMVRTKHYSLTYLIKSRIIIVRTNPQEPDERLQLANIIHHWCSCQTEPALSLQHTNCFRCTGISVFDTMSFIKDDSKRQLGFDHQLTGSTRIPFRINRNEAALSESSQVPFHEVLATSQA